MKGKLFYEGQAVTLKKVTSTWYAQNTTVNMLKDTKHGYGPKPGEIVHCGEFMFDDGEWWMRIQEYPGVSPVRYWYAQEEFAPVVSDSVLSKELEEIFQEDLVESK